MIRASLLWLSEQARIFKFVRSNRLARRFAARFVAGETVETAVGAVRELNAAGITASLDLLGESVASATEAAHARDTYLESLDRIRSAGVDANVSVKLTQMGLDIDERLCLENVGAIIAKAKGQSNFVRVDMEGSAYTEATLRVFKERLYPQYGNAAGVVLQSYLFRTEKDVDDMIALGARVRLCKGAYKEPPAVAYPKKADVDASYVRCLERLLARGNYPGIATHDERILAHAQTYARNNDIAPERFEFQMLYGVRRDLQLKLRRDGWRVRVYVPFGTHWYPYLMRRLAERPANIAFIVGNVVKESLRRR